MSHCYYVHVQDAQYHKQFGATRTIEVVVHVHFVNVTLTSPLCEIGMGDSKNFMSRYIIRVIITIIDIITISFNSATGTKIVKMSWKYFTDMNVAGQ